MPIDYQKLTEASLRLKITDLERARRYELEQLKQAVTLLDEVLDQPLDQNSLHKRISIFLDGTIYPVARDAQLTNGCNSEI